MGILSKEAILAADDIRRERVAVPEWGGDVFVRTITGMERDAWERRKADETSLPNLRGSLVALCCCNEAGGEIFKPSDAGAVGRKSAAALDRIVEVAMRLNGIGEEETKELAKNSDGAPSDVSPSGSPGTSESPDPT